MLERTAFFASPSTRIPRDSFLALDPRLLTLDLDARFLPQHVCPLWQWGLLALVPLAIVALYFLKLKRQPLEVPSTYLWKRSIEDLHVNSLWQRLRQNLLLLLQLCSWAWRCSRCCGRAGRARKLEGQRFIFLVDNSASMSADRRRRGRQPAGGGRSGGGRADRPDGFRA